MTQAASYFPQKDGEMRPGFLERRRHHRLPTNDHAMVSLVNPLAPERVAGIIFNASKTGMGIKVASEVPKNADVRIQVGKIIVTGEVRRCEAARDGFELGIEIDEVLYFSHLH